MSDNVELLKQELDFYKECLKHLMEPDELVEVNPDFAIYYYKRIRNNAQQWLRIGAEKGQGVHHD